MKILAAIMFAFIALPPIQYRHNTETAVYFMSAEGVESTCEMLTQLPNRLACANSNEIIAPNPCSYRGDYYADILCHELGHVNGWSHND
jgi:hypothetical protein